MNPERLTGLLGEADELSAIFTTCIKNATEKNK